MALVALLVMAPVALAIAAIMLWGAFKELFIVGRRLYGLLT